MRTVLANIAELRGNRIGELMLDGEVPLLTHGWPEILIDNPNSLSRVAGEVNRCTSSGRRIAGGESTASRGLLDDPEWRVYRKLLVGPASFEERGNGVTSADHGLSA